MFFFFLVFLGVFVFVNGIEIIFMFIDFYYKLSVSFMLNGFVVLNSMVFELMYWLNIGGDFILLVNDLGLYWSWLDDEVCFVGLGDCVVNLIVLIKYWKIVFFVVFVSVY